jgi:hypothetical protein
MTNPFNRGTAPGRERDASQRPDTFKPGQKRLPGSGRKNGTPNALSTDYKRAVIAAAYFVGRDGKGAGGLVGYFQRLLFECPEVGLMLLARMFLHEDGWPPDDWTRTNEQINEQVRDLIGRANKTGSGSPEPATTEWPIPDLMRIAVKYPKDFGKRFAAMVPQPRGRPRRSRWEGMTSVESEPTSAGESSERNAGSQFLAACALLYGQARRPPASVEPRGDAALLTRVESPHPGDELSNESRHQRPRCAVEYGRKIG